MSRWQADGRGVSARSLTYKNRARARCAAPNTQTHKTSRPPQQNRLIPQPLGEYTPWPGAILGENRPEIDQSFFTFSPGLRALFFVPCFWQSGPHTPSPPSLFSPAVWGPPHKQKVTSSKGPATRNKDFTPLWSLLSITFNTNRFY